MANKTEHQKAGQLIQLKLDGMLEESEAMWLESHLRSCRQCRRLDAQLQRLDGSLRQDFSMQRSASPTSNLRSLPVTAFDPIHNLSRANMNTSKLKSFANALVSLVLLVALTGGLAWVLSTQLRPPAPGSGQSSSATPTLLATLTATPFFTPTPVPLPAIGTTGEIVQTLKLLANAEALQYPASGWTHAIQQDQSGASADSMSGSFIESWVHIDQGDCKEGFIVTKDSPEGKTFYQILVFLPERVQGDLVTLRRPGAQEDHAAPSWLSCSHVPENTEAWGLAQRLDPDGSEPLSKEPNDLKEVKAWYEDADTQPVLVVEAVFTQTGSTPEVQRETRRFEVGTGMALGWQTKMEWADGSPFGEMNRQQSIQIFPELPEDVAAQYADYAAELRSYVDPLTGQIVQPIATPLPAGQSTNALDLAYTADAPLTDLARIIDGVKTLGLRNATWLAEPGWHLYTSETIDPAAGISPYSELIHSLSDGTCEIFSFYTDAVDGSILRNQVILANGDWGATGSLDDPRFTDGAAGANPCRIDSFYTQTILKNLIWTLERLKSGERQGSSKLWLEQRNGHGVIVLYDTQDPADPQETVMDPETRKLEKLDRVENWNFLNPETGASLSNTSVYYLQNGTVIGMPPQPDEPNGMQIIDYETLPENLAQAFDQAKAGLQEYLAGKK